MINRTHKLSIRRQAQLLEISRGTVYYLPRAACQTDLRLMRRIDEIHLLHRAQAPGCCAISCAQRVSAWVAGTS